MKNMIKNESVYEIIIAKESPDVPNIIVEIENERVKITFNSYRMFNTLSQKDAVLIALNEKLTDILDKHLKTEAKHETALKGQR